MTADEMHMQHLCLIVVCASCIGDCVLELFAGRVCYRCGSAAVLLQLADQDLLAKQSAGPMLDLDLQSALLAGTAMTSLSLSLEPQVWWSAHCLTVALNSHPTPSSH